MSHEQLSNEIQRGFKGAVVFVDDFVGSGQQFVRTWDRSLRTQYESFKALAPVSQAKFYYCPAFCTQYGLNKIKSACAGVSVNPGVLIPDNYGVLHPDSIVWPSHLRSTAADFLYSASMRAGIPKEKWRGFASLGLTIAFEDSVPDATLPMMYWENNRVASTHAKDRMMSDIHNVNSDTLARLSELFGAHKAEWLGARLFELFSTPSYFPLITTSRPCILVGGRGTGKTTVLRGLSYQGRFELENHNKKSIPSWPYYGFYHRVDTNKVGAFKGPELTDIEWLRHFGHYMNLLMCGQVLRFLDWFQTTSQTSTELLEDDLASISAAFNLESPSSNRDLLQLLERSLIEFEAHINNVADGSGPSLSMQGAPIRLLLESVKRLDVFADKLFFFLIDEYENLEDYQQQLMNTLIKHSGELYSFKICARELGWRVHNTTSGNESLISPADYIRIDIAEVMQDKGFEEFSHKVCQDRLTALVEGNDQVGIEIKELFPPISEEEEATLLGIEDHNRDLLQELKKIGPPEIVERLTPMEICLLGYWAKSHNQSLNEAFEDFKKNSHIWRTRLDNYKHALLFTIRRGRTGISKYYAGWDTFIQLSGGNIRFLLQLVEESLTRHLRAGQELYTPLTPALQTRAAQAIGRTNLTELEGLSVHGAQLAKLLLGLGRILGIMAAFPEGHAPEVNQFEVVRGPGVSTQQNDADTLLTAAVMHLALARHSGSKLSDVNQTRDWDYAIYPIFAPFFNFSYRRKRKMRLTPDQVLALVNSSKQAISQILADKKQHREETLPEQLRLFEAFYAQSD